MANQKWDPELYAKNAGFVVEHGQSVLDLLAPKEGEMILDIGCGDGVLTKKLLKEKFRVFSVDASSEMVDAARANDVHARLVDAQELDYEDQFHAIYSNAAIHWMDDHYALVRGVWRALKPGGRFVAECGGEGCVRVIREGMKIALAKLGVDYKSRNPWKFPETGMFTKILENQGFTVTYIARIDRPTPISCGLRGWLELFSQRHTEGMSNDDREKFYAEVEDRCKPRLWSEQNGWSADYVSLRFVAVKPEESQEA